MEQVITESTLDFKANYFLNLRVGLVAKNTSWCVGYIGLPKSFSACS